MVERITSIDTWLTFKAQRLSAWWIRNINLPDDVLIQTLFIAAGAAALFRIFFLHQMFDIFLLMGVLMSYSRGRKTHAVALEQKVLEIMGVPPSLSWFPLFAFQMLLAMGLCSVMMSVVYLCQHYAGIPLAAVGFWDNASVGIGLVGWMVGHFILRSPPGESLQVRKTGMQTSMVGA